MGSKYFGGIIVLIQVLQNKRKKLNVAFKSQVACKAINFPFFVNDHDTGQCFSKCEHELLVSELLLKIQSPGTCPSSSKSESLGMEARNLYFYQCPQVMPMQTY